MDKSQCSKLFSKIFDSGCAGCIRVCECGITYFDSYNNWDWEEGEFEELMENAKSDPEKYVETSEAIGTLSIDNKEIVWGCSCDLAKNYETFIQRHAIQLAEYLNERAKQFLKMAENIKVGDEKAT